VLVAGCSIVVGNLNDPHNQSFLTAHDDLITCLSVSNAGGLLASGQKGDNSDILIWDYSTKKAMFRLSEHDYEICHLNFSHDDRLLISTGNQLDGKLFIWNTSNGYIVSSLQLIPQVFANAVSCLKWGGYVKDVKLRPTAKYQFAMAGAKKLTIWGLEPSTGQCFTENISTGTFVRDYTCMCFSLPDE
jgi:WD40 repeat protein